MPALTMPPRFLPHAATLLAAAFVLSSCSDLALEPDRVPDKLIVEPSDTLITQGDRAQLRVTVLDQDGQPFPVLPTWALPRWTASHPEALTIAPDGGLEALGGGEIQVEARLAGLVTRSTVRVNPDRVVLSAPTIYLAQAVQNRAGDVPMVAGRMALLRVFVTSEPSSFYQPRGRASFYLNGSLSYETALLPGSYLIPEVVDERRMERSFNALIPGDVLQPGVELVVELDVEGVVPLAPGSHMRFPAEGKTALDVQAVPPMVLTIVPTLLAQDPNEQIFTWTSGLNETSSAIRFTRSVLPIGDLDVVVHEPYTTSADLTTKEGWSQFLREISIMRVAEGSDGYYYGAVVLPAGSPYGGLGYVGAPASVGRPTESTLAHEIGHNVSLRHAPCGGVSSYDSGYPYSGGVIGVWGYGNLGGSGLGTLHDPDQYKDLMGYCSPRWISDYHFTKALAYRVEEESLLRPGGAPEPVLLLWGSVDRGVLQLEPVFALDAPPVLPAEPGPYQLEGVTEVGRRLFSLDFGLTEVSQGGGHFSFAVPMDPDDLGALHTVTLKGPEGAATIDRTTPTRPTTLVLDGATGQIRGILRDGTVPAALPAGLVVMVSDGLPTGGPEGGRE